VTWAGTTGDARRLLSVRQVDALAAGATLLGSGGGGDVALGAQLLRHLLVERPVPVVPAGELPPDALVVHVGIVGGPDVLAERLIDPADLAVAARAVVDRLDGDLAAVGVIEIGGLNAAAGVLAAAQLDVPVVDGDLMGRAFPRISQTTLAVAGHPPTPIGMVGAGGDVVVMPVCSAHSAQALVAACASAMGGAGALALYPAKAAVLTEAGVRDSVSRCVRLGADYLASTGLATTELVDRLGGQVVIEGRIDELRPRLGAAPGSLTIGDHATGPIVRVDHLDEFLAVTVDGSTVAATPDVIVAMDPSSRKILRSDQVRLGQPLAVFTLPALHTWPAAAAAVVGPAAFGLDLEPVPR
jgi:DUF917 family protein